ncbi:MAG TPA: hypothetical protein VF163_04230 [Micromonosporaceae bacterium]
MTARPRPLYARLLRLRHIDLSPTAAMILFEGSITAGALLVLADIVPVWGLLVLPLAVAGTVKFNDLVTGADTRPQPAAPSSQPHPQQPQRRQVRAVGRTPAPRVSRPTVWIDLDDVARPRPVRGDATGPAEPGDPSRLEEGSAPGLPVDPSRPDEPTD